jgi:hypothetical protein
MRGHVYLAAGLLVAGASLARAEINEAQIVRDLNQQGFGNVEFRHGGGFTKVEAWRGAHELEITYDQSTGVIVERELELHPDAPGLALGRPAGGARTDDDDDSDDDDSDDGLSNDRDDDQDADRDTPDSDDGPGNDRDDDGNDDRDDA